MFTPVKILKNSPAKWTPEPTPAEANLTLPAFAFAYSMKSGTVVTGSDGLTSIKCGTRTMAAIGAISRTKLKVRFGNNDPLIALGGPIIRSVYPSAGALTTASVPILPALPGLFSTRNSFPRRSDSHWPIKRARMSCGPPGAKATMMRTGRDG